MDEKLRLAKEILTKYNQEHLLDAFSKIDNNEEKEKFLDEILTIDFNHVNDMYAKRNKVVTVDENTKIEPIEYIEKAKLSKKEYSNYDSIGAEEIKSGKLAVVTMAGGQGTRLGHSGPKGTYFLDVEGKKSIFAILADIMKEGRNKYNVDIPWYIMTSDENNEATVKFFEENKYFDYPKSAITFFKQGKLPMVDTEGKVLIDEKNKIKLAADGHGGIFVSMLKDGVIYDMKARGIEWVFIGGVDNVLVKPIDSVLVGFAKEEDLEAAGKSVVKANPHERVGVFCKKNGKPSVMEYSEISDELAEALDENGELKFAESHILCNLFRIDAIEKISEMKLPYHAAFKKAKYIGEDGKVVEPKEPNAYKFEAFLFDAFESLNNVKVMRVKREEEFAPVKNKEGVDSPETAKKLYNDFHKKS